MRLTTEQKIHYTVRTAVAMCLIGHGAFGIITKPIWCNYFAVFGIHQDAAYSLMPWVGGFDILFGIAIIFYPLRAIPVWLVGWGLVTACLRPASGEPFAELIERAGNFGAPFVLLLLSGGATKENIFKRIPSNNHLDERAAGRFIFCLQIIVFLLLAGHGWLNLIEKKSLIQQYTSLGFADPRTTAKTIGILEIFSAVAVLFRPLRPLLAVLIIWKIFSELFYPRHELFEWIERGGSYGCLIALWLATGLKRYQNWSNKLDLAQDLKHDTAPS